MYSYSYYLQLFLSTPVSYYILVMYAPHSLLPYTGGGSSFSTSVLLSLYFHIPNLNHANPILAFELHLSIHISLPHETREISEIIYFLKLVAIWIFFICGKYALWNLGVRKILQLRHGPTMNKTTWIGQLVALPPRPQLSWTLLYV